MKYCLDSSIDKNDRIIYKSLRNIETSIDRRYFLKYIKYKKKYIQLKYNS